MNIHPFLQGVKEKICGTISVIIAMTGLFLYLHLYGAISIAGALLGSAIFISLFCIAGYYYWFLFSLFSDFRIRLSINVILQILCTVLSLVISLLFGIISSWQSLWYVPMFFIYGFLLWGILILYYYISRDSIIADENMNDDSLEELESSSDVNDIIDVISVKNGNKIHLIKVEELYCIQADGDYVSLITENKKYLKEQTMKYYEMSLPAYFVRIHRSCIVNSFQISRIELYGKETYHVHLKNDMSVRASVAGYKLLKKKLSL